MRRILLTQYKGRLLYSLWENDKPTALALYPPEGEGPTQRGDI